MSALPVGVHEGVPMDAYLADPCEAPSLSSGCVHTILTRSAFHAWADHPKNPNRIEKDEGTVPDIGTLAHALLLEGNTSRAEVIDPQNYRGSRGGIPKGWTNDAIRAARDAARAAGKVPILPKDMERVKAMRDAAVEFIRNSEIADIFEAGGIAESVIIARREGVWLRARPDWLAHDLSFHISFKTTPGSAEPISYARFRLTSEGYDTGLQFYDRAIEGVTGSMPDSCLLVQEQKPPFRCSLVGLTPAARDLCDRKIDLATRIFSECLASGRWPEYPTRICYADPLPWHEAQFEERRAIDELQEREGLQA